MLYFPNCQMILNQSKQQKSQTSKISGGWVLSGRPYHNNILPTCRLPLSQQLSNPDELIPV